MEIRLRRSASLRDNIMELSFQSRRAVAEMVCDIASRKPADTAVLYRNNESALPIVTLLDRKGIPYRIKGNDTRSNDYVEERRLFYVAVTRAKNHLRFLSVQSEEDSPSEFLREALTLAPVTRLKMRT